MSNSLLITPLSVQKGQQHSQINSNNSLGINHQASGSTNTQASSAMGANFFVMLGSPQARKSFPYVTSFPFCLVPESFAGTSVFEEYSQRFNKTARLSEWHFNTNDNRPLYFALRLMEDALHFYITLSFEQQTFFDLLIEALRQNYKTNGDILKASLKAAKQQLKQCIAVLLCDVRTLARWAYHDFPELIDSMVLTTFVVGLSDENLRWELRQVKPQTADDTLTAAMERNVLLEFENGNSTETQKDQPSTDSATHEQLEKNVRLVNQCLQNSQL